MPVPRSIVLALLAAMVAVTVCTSAVGVARAATCENRDQPGEVVRETPWPQTVLVPERAWPFTTGQGITVAVVDAGTDARHPQLLGAVEAGFDLVEDTAAGDDACVARGTAIASMIAGRHVPGIGFRGFAPAAQILPVRIADSELNDNQLERPTVDPDDLAAGIRWAVAHDAQIINVSVALYTGSRRLRAAVERAHRRDVLIVAPAGDNHDDDRFDPIPFPASYPSVLGVGAIDRNGQREEQSQVGEYVDVVAPGDDVVGAALGAGYQTYTGTGFATAFASATAALVRSAYPELDAQQVHQRLRATASPSLGGGKGPAYGSGVIDPYRAVTESLSMLGPVQAPPLQRPVSDPRAVAHAARRADAAGRARVLLAGAVIVAGAAVVAAMCWPRGRRRRWRPGLRPQGDAGSLDDAIAGTYRGPIAGDDIFAPSSTNRRP